jgi:hypothetical protein
MKLGLTQLLEWYGFPKDKAAKLVRHSHPKIEAFVDSGIIDIYQAYQSKPIFHNVNYIVSFYPAGGSRAIFYGVFEVTGKRNGQDDDAPIGCEDAVEWQKQCAHFYELRRVPGFEELEHRLVIEWGKAAISWHQQLKSNDKTIFELLPPGRTLAPFVDYLEFTLSFDELCKLFKHPDAHPDWRSSLRSVAGVYLILAEGTGDLYVGSAYGAEGIWGRWSKYADTCHGDNKRLKDLIETSGTEVAKQFRFSILQILPKSFTRDEVIKRESLFKKKLGSRAHGLNAN